MEGRRVSNFAFNWLLIKDLSPVFEIDYTKDSLFFIHIVQQYIRYV